MSLVLTTAPDVEPLLISEAKSHLVVQHKADDLFIYSLIRAARESAEKYTGVLLVDQSWTKYLDRFPSSGSEELKPNVSEITSIKYQDADNIEKILSPSVYELNKDSVVSGFRLAYDQSWPEVLNHPESIEIEFVCGYGEEIPQGIKHAMLLLIGHWYENREATSALTIKDVPMAVKFLLDPYRIVNL